MKRHWLLLCIMTIGLPLLLPAHGQAATLYVNKDGSAQFKSIQKAIETAGAGDTVIVEPGDYWEDILIHNQKNLTVEALESFSEKSSTIHGVKDVMGLGMLKIIKSENIAIKGFTLVGTRNAPKNILYVSSASFVIENNEIRGKGKTAVMVCPKSKGEVIGNRISNVRTAVEVSKSKVKLLYNKVYNGSAFGLRAQNTSQVLADHNTFHNISGTAVLAGPTTTLTLYNNCLSTNGLALKGTKKIQAGYNLYFNNRKNFSGFQKGTGDLFADPKFLKPKAGDFRLATDSPAIGKGRDGLDIGSEINN